MNIAKQPWIYSASLDGAFILAPSLLITALVLFLRDHITDTEGIPLWLWGVLVAGIDVGHVYSTLFRTYADPYERAARRNLYLLVPLVCWVISAILYSLKTPWFWHALTYLAVFHFVRQQYGFMMIYSRQERKGKIARYSDQAAIYMATLYPLLYWHTHMPRNFDWFIENDFIPIPFEALSKVGFVLYVLTLAFYIIKEIRTSFAERTLNIPKNILLLGTTLSWFVGIIGFNNDLAFTATNIITHGIPYIALIWIYGHNRGASAPSVTLLPRLSFRFFFSGKMLLIYIATLIGLGYLEEGLWDGFIWTEHKSFFRIFHILPTIDDHALLSWLVPLLALPQMTHYVLDAYIWRLNKSETDWKKILFYKTART